MTTPTKTHILHPCRKCGKSPQIVGVKKHGVIYHTIKCACGNNVISVSSLLAAIEKWNLEN